jgi:predicted lipid-binding transport protein (Tim44 family)
MHCPATGDAERMPDVFDIYTIIFLALAVFIFLRLRSVLGQRTGRERPPFMPRSPQDVVARPATEKVVTLPQRSAEAPPRPAETAPSTAERWKDIAETGSTVAAGLDAIAGADPSFDAKHFITGARTAYEMIVTAFAGGDRRQLRSLLSREVSDGFDAAITERERRSETAETRFISIDGSTITAAELRNRTAQITVRFVSKLVSATRDRSGAVIDGSADKVTDVTDVWTFARDISSRDPNWKVVATEAGQ